MIIRSKKIFDKQFAKLPPKIKQKATERIKLFSENPHDAVLRNHSLHGDLIGLRSFSVTGDIRVIFEERGGYVLVYFIAIGSHNQLYK